MSSASPAFRVTDAPPAAAPSPSNVVVFFRVDGNEIERPPPGYKSVESVIETSESVSERRVLMEEARKQIAQDFYSARKSPLAQLRLSKGLSQARLAKELGTTQSHIARLEGGADLMLSTVARLADALGIKREELAATLVARE